MPKDDDNNCRLILILILLTFLLAALFWGLRCCKIKRKAVVKQIEPEPASMDEPERDDGGAAVPVGYTVIADQGNGIYKFGNQEYNIGDNQGVAGECLWQILFRYLNTFTINQALVHGGRQRGIKQLLENAIQNVNRRNHWVYVDDLQGVIDYINGELRVAGVQQQINFGAVEIVYNHRTDGAATDGGPPPTLPPYARRVFSNSGGLQLALLMDRANRGAHFVEAEGNNETNIEGSPRDGDWNNPKTDFQFQPIAKLKDMSRKSRRTRPTIELFFFRKTPRMFTVEPVMLCSIKTRLPEGITLDSTLNNALQYNRPANFNIIKIYLENGTELDGTQTLSDALGTKSHLVVHAWPDGFEQIELTEDGVSTQLSMDNPYADPKTVYKLFDKNSVFIPNSSLEITKAYQLHGSMSNTSKFPLPEKFSFQLTIPPLRIAKESQCDQSLFATRASIDRNDGDLRFSKSSITASVMRAIRGGVAPLVRPNLDEKVTTSFYDVEPYFYIKEYENREGHLNGLKLEIKMAQTIVGSAEVTNGRTVNIVNGTADVNIESVQMKEYYLLALFNLNRWNDHIKISKTDDRFIDRGGSKVPGGRIIAVLITMHDMGIYTIVLYTSHAGTGAKYQLIKVVWLPV
ncbi:MAG: hypothetical protein LBJ32_04625 [Oscillospiraceae bacterium]|jgi:hypothetical protein|nr:hypothetical protein [Oscillospiraceae bacterium]